MGIIKGALQFSLGMLFLEGLKLIFKRLIPLAMAGVGLSQGLGISPIETFMNYVSYFFQFAGHKLHQLLDTIGLSVITDFDYMCLWSTGGIMMIVGATVMVRTLFSR